MNPELKEKVIAIYKEMGPFKHFDDENIDVEGVEERKIQEYQFKGPNVLYRGQWKGEKPHGRGFFVVPDGGLMEG